MLERLQKIIARAGIASRRHAEQLITSGQVSVNGVVVTELGAKADPERDRVEAAGKVAERPASANSYILYKPANVVSTMSDPEGRATLRHLLRGQDLSKMASVFPVGRLDYDASGLVLLTSDGELADRIFKSSARLPKVFWMKVKGRLTEDLLYKIRHEAHVKMRRLAGPAAAREHSAENPWYEVEVSDARRDLLPSALFAAGHPVEKLKRVRFGPLDLGDLQEGHFRQLAPSEVDQLRKAVERASNAPQPPPQGKSEFAKRHRWTGARKPLRIGPGGQPPNGAPRPIQGQQNGSSIENRVEKKFEHGDSRFQNKDSRVENRFQKKDSHARPGPNSGRPDRPGQSSNRRDTRSQGHDRPGRPGQSDRRPGYGGPARPGQSNRGAGYGGPARPGQSNRGAGYGGPARPGQSNRGAGYGGPARPGQSNRGAGYGGPARPGQSNRGAGHGTPARPGQNNRRPGYGGPARPGQSSRGAGYGGPARPGQSNRGQSHGGPARPGQSSRGPSHGRPNRPGQNSPGRGRPGPGSRSRDNRGGGDRQGGKGRR
jgi:23S rRNA pseudouridine2605 synthase